MLKAILAGTLLLLPPPADDPCMTDCTETVWVLEFNGHAVSVGRDMTEDECADLLAEIDPQTPGFSFLECVPYEVKRERA